MLHPRSGSRRLVRLRNRPRPVLRPQKPAWRNTTPREPAARGRRGNLPCSGASGRRVALRNARGCQCFRGNILFRVVDASHGPRRGAGSGSGGGARGHARGRDRDRGAADHAGRSSHQHWEGARVSPSRCRLPSPSITGHWQSQSVKPSSFTCSWTPHRRGLSFRRRQSWTMPDVRSCSCSAEARRSSAAPSRWDREAAWRADHRRREAGRSSRHERCLSRAARVVVNIGARAWACALSVTFAAGLRRPRR